MSEQNVLNPNAQSDLNPEYPIKITSPRAMARSQARSGATFARRVISRGDVFQLQWNNRLYSTYSKLRQWFAQYEQDFFTLYDLSRNRYFTGMFDDEPQYENAGNDKVNISASFIEVPGLKMFQYPANWGVDSVFMDEVDSLGNNLVKLTGTWDHQDVNYAMFSQQFTNGVWSSTSANLTVTDNTQVDPNGGNTAATLSLSSAGPGGSFLFQPLSINARPGFYPLTFSIYLKAPVATSAFIGISRGGGGDFETLPVNVTTNWVRYSYTHTTNWTGVNQVQIFVGLNNVSTSLYPWGAQTEWGSAPSPYVSNTNTATKLSNPSSLTVNHAGFAYYDVGTNTADAAEWLYFGYGFRLWSYRGPDMGIAQLFLDGTSLGNVDLYSAAGIASSAVFTQQNVSLGLHRVKIAPTNTKHAASSAFVVSADAIEVMR